MPAKNTETPWEFQKDYEQSYAPVSINMPDELYEQLSTLAARKGWSIGRTCDYMIQYAWHCYTSPSYGPYKDEVVPHARAA